MLVSIIVPIYKVEQYLHECIDSLLMQTYKEIEIILVDDGSPDKCPQICDNYAEKHSFIKVVHKKNEGLCSAWMSGLENTDKTSDYITFIDPDDKIPPDYIEYYVGAMDKYRTDIVVGNMIKFRNKEEIKITQNISGLFNKDRLEKEFYPIFLNNGNFHGRTISLSRCAKLYRKELIINNIKYCNPKTSYVEDLNIVFPVILDAQSIFFLKEDQGIYYYRMNPLSMLHTYDKNMLHSIQYVYPSLKQICIDKNHQELIQQVDADYLAASVQYFKNELQNPNGLSETQKKIREFIRDKELQRIINEVDWRKYRKLNILIIRAMKDYNWFYANIVTTLLSILKRSGIRKPS